METLHVGKRNHGFYNVKRVQRTEAVVPNTLIEIFPELNDKKFFVADVEHWAGADIGNKAFRQGDHRWICEPRGGESARRWEIGLVADLSTKQIVAILDLLPHLDKNQYGNREHLRLQGVDFGRSVEWFKESATHELIHRSLVDYINHPDTPSTAWLAEHFEKKSYWHVEWLAKVATNQNGLSSLHEHFPQSTAVKFASEERVEGIPEQWEFLKAIPAYRKEVRFCPFDGQPYFYLPGSGEKISVQKSGSSYFRARDDGRMDLFLHRGSRELGDMGWMWVLVNPSESEGVLYPQVEAALDPLNNYSGIGCGFTPLSDRITETFARVIKVTKTATNA